MAKFVKGVNEMGYERRSFGGNRSFHERRFDNDRAPPVKVGDELEVTIEAVAEKGDGLTKKDGFVIFVPGTQTGDKVKIRVTKVLRRVGFAEKIDSEGSSESSSEPEEETQESETDESQDSEDF